MKVAGFSLTVPKVLVAAGVGAAAVAYYQFRAVTWITENYFWDNEANGRRSEHTNEFVSATDNVHKWMRDYKQNLVHSGVNSDQVQGFSAQALEGWGNLLSGEVNALKVWLGIAVACFIGAYVIKKREAQRA